MILFVYESLCQWAFFSSLVVQTNWYITLDAHDSLLFCGSRLETPQVHLAFPFLLFFFLLSLLDFFSSSAHGVLILSTVLSRSCALSAVKVTVCQWRLNMPSHLGILPRVKTLQIALLDTEVSIIWLSNVNGRLIKAVPAHMLKIRLTQRGWFARESSLN